MTSIGPRDPQVETYEEYLQRIVANAGPLTEEQIDRLAALLGFGTRERGEVGG